VNLDIIITDSNPERVARFQAVFDGHPHLKAARIRPNEFFKIPGLDAIYMSTVAAERWGAKPIMHEAQVLPTSPEDRLENWPAHIVAGVAIKTEEKGNPKFELELIVESAMRAIHRFNSGEHEVIRTVALGAQWIALDRLDAATAARAILSTYLRVLGEFVDS
jgi:hypothetical protein